MWNQQNIDDIVYTCCPQLHIDSGPSPDAAPQEKKEEDFFAIVESTPIQNPVNANESLAPKPVVRFINTLTIMTVDWYDFQIICSFL